MITSWRCVSVNSPIGKASADIVLCLKTRELLLYHLGFRGHLSRTNLAYANRHRDWRLFQAVAQVLMRRATRRYQDQTLGAGKIPVAQGRGSRGQLRPEEFQALTNGLEVIARIDWYRK